MKKSLKVLLTSVSLMAVLLGTNTVYGATTTTATTQSQTVKIAIVDVPKVVDSSAQVKALRKAQETKSKEMMDFVEKARLEIASTTDTKKKASLEEKYNKELKTKQEAIKKDYAEKLNAIDTSISKQIETIAKNNGYTIVVAKSMVLYGGDDITDKVINAVK